MIKTILFTFFFGLAFQAISVSAKNNNQALLDFEIIPMHYEFLNGKPHYSTETKGLVGFELLYDVSIGEKKIALKAVSNLQAEELIVYQSTAGTYHIAQLAGRAGNTLILNKVLDKGIAKGAHIWNFYNDGSHPNAKGFKALADFALSKLKKGQLQNKVHAFIGDSWFDEGSFEKHINNKINVLQSINKAVGGRTSLETLNAFDQDFPAGSVAPDFFWISLSTNDYWGDVTAEDFSKNMETIITKINALGAKAIVLDASVGPYGYDDIADKETTIQKDLSDAYANELQALYDKNQPVVITPEVPSQSSTGGGSFTFELLVLMGLLFRLKVLRTEDSITFWTLTCLFDPA